MQRRERSTPVSTTPGERKLPGGRVVTFAAVVLAGVLAACAAPAATTAPSISPISPIAPSQAAGASPTTAPSPPVAIPTLGTTPPSGLGLPSYFVTLLDVKNGSLGVLTAPGSSCSVSLKAPDGTVTDYPAKITDASGVARFTYPPVSGHGESIQTMTCRLGDQSGTAKGQVILP